MSLLSVVIPAYNEGAMIHKTAEVVSSLLSENNIEYEIIFVNDGSKDTTWEEIVNASANNKNIKGVCFSRNFGKEGAVFAGLEHASGDCCVVMDCDLHQKQFWKCISFGQKVSKLWKVLRLHVEKKALYIRCL